MRSEGVTVLAVSPSRVQAQAGRTLDFLHVIEKTIDALTQNCDVLEAISAEVIKLLEALKVKPPAASIDPEGRARELMSKSIATLERMHAAEQLKRNAAAADHRLDEDDGVVEAFDSLLSCLARMHEVTYEFKEWIDTHEALLEPAIGPVYENAEELFKAILEEP